MAAASYAGGARRCNASASGAVSEWFGCRRYSVYVETAVFWMCLECSCCRGVAGGVRVCFNGGFCCSGVTAAVEPFLWVLGGVSRSLEIVCLLLQSRRLGCVILGEFSSFDEAS